MEGSYGRYGFAPKAGRRHPGAVLAFGASGHVFGHHDLSFDLFYLGDGAFLQRSGESLGSFGDVSYLEPAGFFGFQGVSGVSDPRVDFFHSVCRHHLSFDHIGLLAAF